MGRHSRTLSHVANAPRPAGRHPFFCFDLLALQASFVKGEFNAPSMQQFATGALN
jgi:hypothetical protein